LTAELRALASPTVPELAEAPSPEQAPLIPDLRLLDMVVCTSMDDRIATRAGRSPRWLGRPVGAHIPVEAVAPELIHPAGAAQAEGHLRRCRLALPTCRCRHRPTRHGRKR
jgi:hypothetical protein